MKKKVRTKKKNILGKTIIAIVIILAILSSILIYFNLDEKAKEKLKLELEKELISNINEHYNEYVITNKESIIYDDNEKEIGKISSNVEITLENETIDKNTKYFKLKDFENTYIKYEDVNVLEKLSEINYRYKNYIVFNENIITKNVTRFYDEAGNLIYEFNNSFNLPIIIKETDKYGVEFNNRLLYVMKEDVENTVEEHNTDKTNSSAVAVLNYHFFYDDQDPEDTKRCNELLCLSKSKFRTHLEYLKENNINTLKMKEFEMYIDGKIQLPKSTLITIDDGGSNVVGIDLLAEYKMNSTLFLITSWFDAKNFSTGEYLELHSHSHDLHNVGACPGGQGGGIKCLDKELLLNDLKKSREELNGTTAFCYPFYEYNNYSISVLKEAGFTMAFAGPSGDSLAKVGTDKYRIPRVVILGNTTAANLDYYFKKIKS